MLVNNSTNATNTEFSPLLSPIIKTDGPSAITSIPDKPLTEESAQLLEAVWEPSHQTFAATSATEEEERIAKLGRLPDGSKPVKVAKRIWRAQVKNTYEEEEATLNDEHGTDWMFKELGKCAIKETAEPPKRDDIILWDENKHKSEFENSIQWRDCPDEWRPILEYVIKDNWDAFAKEGMKRHILGWIFNVDTGTIKPVCCKQPRYGPHESRVMIKLVNSLQDKGLIEDDFGPWGAQVVLASKPNQGHVHWSQYVFRLCVSYRKLNAVTRPFQFYILRCDDAVDQVGDAKYFITMDLDAGYWQVKLAESSREKTAFFTPEGKKHWLVMPMGILNAHAFFVCMTTNFKKEWHELYKANPRLALQKLFTIVERHRSAIEDLTGKETTRDLEQGLAKALAETDPGSSVIVDDVMVFDTNILSLVAYFVTVLEILVKYRVTVNLRKTRFLPPRAEFVGRDLLPQGNSPAQSKYATIEKLCAPANFGDIQMLNGLFGYYSPWIPHLEIQIQKWREYVKEHKPAPGESTEEEIKKKVSDLWTKEDETQLEKLKRAILDGPVLKRPNSARRFYLKTDWSSNAMGAVLLQPDLTEEAEEAMLKEIEGGKCAFDLAISKLRLRPVAFLSRICKGKERDYHSFIGEAATGLWAMRKFKQWLVGREFTWITDCSGLTKFFEGEFDMTHTTQRWKMELLALNFTIVHRPARMLVECDLMSRYQGVVETWREQQDTKHTANALVAAAWQAEAQPEKWPIQNLPPVIVGPATNNKTDIAKACDQSKATWTIGRNLDTIQEAYSRLGGTILHAAGTSESEYWQEHHDIPNIATFATRLTKTHKEKPPVELLIVNDMAEYKSQKHQKKLRTVVECALQQGATCVVLAWTGTTRTKDMQAWTKYLGEATKAKEDMGTSIQTIDGKLTQAHIDTPHTMILCAHKKVVREWTRSIEDAHKDTYAMHSPTEGVLDEPNENYNGYCSMAAIESHQVKICQPDGKEEQFPIQDTQEIASHEAHKRATSNIFIETTDAHAPAAARTLRPRENLSLLGFDRHRSLDILQEDRVPWKEIKPLMSKAIPAETWMQVLTCVMAKIDTRARFCSKEERKELVKYATDKKDCKQHLAALTHRSINRFTTLPVPTGEQWKEYCAKDQDIQRIIQALKTSEALEYQALTCKLYWREYKDNKLEQEDNILYQYEEPRQLPVRQAKRAVVPERLRQTIIAAYHSTPLAGHVSFHKTLYRIAARFWWPRMTTDVREAVLSCGHCNAANASNHINQKILQATPLEDPFEVCSMDVWFPGKSKAEVNKMSPALRKTLSNKAVVTYVCNLTGCATAAFIANVDSTSMARIAFGQFFTIRGMPRLILIDEGSEMKGELITMCGMLGITHHEVSPESHDGILCERVHRYLNKAQKIGAADLGAYDEWAMNTVFAIYAWNASPIEGTDIQRAFAALGKVFKFPMDIRAEEITEPARKRRKLSPAQEAIERMETMFPLWRRQVDLLKVLTEERREHHRNLKNKLRNQRTFEVNDIVMVRKQVQSNASEGLPAKLVLRQRGPYRVIERLREDTYLLQKIPGTSTMLRTRGSVPIKESAFRMTKIPSTIVIHKRVDTPDTRLAGTRNLLSHSPLEQQLGLVDFGKYMRAAEGATHAFDKIQDLWDEEADPEQNTADEEEPADEPPQYVRDAIQLSQTRSIQAPDPTRRLIVEETRAEEGNQVRDATPQPKIVTRETLPLKLKLQQLYQRIKTSKDKLFAVALPQEESQLLKWHIVGVDLEETDTKLATELGQYHCQWYIPVSTNRSDREPEYRRKFWPLIKEYIDEETFGQTKYVSPGKVEAFLQRNPEKYGWYQRQVNLAEDGIEGPFNFDKQLKIPETVWEEVRKVAATRHIDISDLQHNTGRTRSSRKPAPS